MTDTRSRHRLRRRAHASGRGRRRRSSPRIFSATPPCSCSARKRCCSPSRTASRGASPSMAAPSSPRPPTASASSPAATTARWSRPTPRAKADVIATDAKHRWIDHVALGPDGAVAWSAGKTAFVRTAKASCATFEAPSTVGGLAFAAERLSPRDRPLQRRHAVVSQCAQARRRKSSNGRARISASTVSPDGRFLVTTMQEPMLHGWRLADRKHMRMSGYARARALARLDRRRRLARHVGRDAAHPLAVPGQGRPDGQAAARAGAVRASRRGRRLPSQAGRSSPPAMPTAWCCWCASRTAPRSWRKKPGDAPVTALAWSADGMLLAFGTERRRSRRDRSRLIAATEEAAMFLKLSAAGGIAVRGPRQFPRLQARGRRRPRSARRSSTRVAGKAELPDADTAWIFAGRAAPLAGRRA